MTPDLCIYHGGCDDGFAAALVVWHKWPDIQFIAGVYGKEPPDVSGKNVLMVDFSYKRPVIEAMAKKAYSLTILDHHKTAQADLADLEAWAAMEGIGASVEVIFDMHHSGAVLAWQFFHGAAPIPYFLKLIEDRDLWRFAHSETKEFSAALRTWPQDFKVWNDLIGNVNGLVADGRPILRAHQANIEKFMADSFTEHISGYDVPCVNVPYHYASDAAHELLKRNPAAPFAAAWVKRGDGLFQASLRSEDARIDVSNIAKKYGGGGHRNAAGFQVPDIRNL